MQTLDFNHQDFAQGRESEADAQLMVRFFMREKKDEDASLTEGRPIFKDREYVEIRVPGKRDALACRPATHDDKRRFPRHYEAFKSRTEMPVEGTPLSEWPQITRSRVEELSFLKVKTVEQLANMPDSSASELRGGLSLKQAAAEFLKSSDKTKLIAEKQALEDRLAKQEAEMAELRAMIKGGATPAKADVPDIDTEAAAPEEDTQEAVEDAPKTRRRRGPAKTED